MSPWALGEQVATEMGATANDLARTIHLHPTLTETTWGPPKSSTAPARISIGQEDSSQLGSLDGKKSISSPEGETVTSAIVILLIKDGSGFKSP